jgi:AraC-like DNA-binding protein
MVRQSSPGRRGRLGETRQVKPQGVLNRAAAERNLRITLHEPSEPLRPFVEHHWFVEWDFEGRDPYVQENLPHPSVHLVFESGGARIYGVPTVRFTRELRGRDRVHGVRFKPGGFHPFVGSPVSRLTDRVVDASSLLGSDIDGLEGIEQVERALLARHPRLDENVETVQAVVARIAADRSVKKLDDLLAGADLHKRTLQRLFREYVGVSPKWVIQRYRLIEAVDRVADGETVDWARLSGELGYFDQAHFIKHFRAVIGRSPTEYAESSGS